MKLKETRLKAVLSQRDLAEKSGVAHATIARIEQGRQKPNFVTIRKLASALNIEPSSLEF